MLSGGLPLPSTKQTPVCVRVCNPSLFPLPWQKLSEQTEGKQAEMMILAQCTARTHALGAGGGGGGGLLGARLTAPPQLRSAAAPILA